MFFFVFDFVFANEDGAIIDFGCIGMYVKESAAICGWSDPLGLDPILPVGFPVFVSNYLDWWE